MSIPLRGRAAFLAVATVCLAAAACKEPTKNPPLKVAKVNIAPDSFDVIINRQYPVQVLALDASGKVITGKVPQFRSDDITIATISATGVVLGISPGKTQIHAVVDGKDGEATVVVRREPVARVVLTAPGGQVVEERQTLQLTADPQDASGNSLADRGCVWTSSNPAVAAVQNNASTHAATVTGVAPGAVTITATCETAFQGIAITVISAIKTATIRITPNGPQVLRLGGTRQLVATPYDAQNNPVANRPQTWTSSNPLVATVDVGTGLVTAVAPGNATISVDIDRVTQSASVLVTLIPLKSVAVAPDSFAIFETTSKQLTLTGVDSAGAPVTDFSQRTLNVLRSSDQTVATVSGSFVVSGVAPGKATIFITVSTPGANEQVSTQTLADIRRINTAAVVINPPNIPSLSATQTLGIQGFAQDSLGRNLANRPVTWTSSDSKIFTVQSQGTNTGVITAVATGTATLTVTNEGKSTTATVTVK